MTQADYEAELSRQREFTLRLAERLYLAAECLANRAEKRRDLPRLPDSLPVVDDCTAGSGVSGDGDGA